MPYKMMNGGKAVGWAMMVSAMISGAQLPATAQPAFKEDQLKYARVRAAFASKEAPLKTAFKAADLTYPPQGLFLRAFKREGLIEVWARDFKGEYRLARSYMICASSGKLGPKRRKGDLQVPEGFYHINHFNPQSNFYLSLGINYPNRSDQMLKAGGDPGGAIYIHGDCVTIGCIPITDEGISELYVLAVEAQAGGQNRIPVHIFPARLDSSGYRQLLKEHAGEAVLEGFWRNLKEGYDYFESTGRVPKVSIDRKGKYHFE